jgi:hypothetical protein
MDAAFSPQQLLASHAGKPHRLEISAGKRGALNQPHCSSWQIEVYCSAAMLLSLFTAINTTMP